MKYILAAIICFTFITPVHAEKFTLLCAAERKCTTEQIQKDIRTLSDMILLLNQNQAKEQESMKNIAEALQQILYMLDEQKKSHI